MQRLRLFGLLGHGELESLEVEGLAGLGASSGSLIAFDAILPPLFLHFYGRALSPRLEAFFHRPEVLPPHELLFMFESLFLLPRLHISLDSFISNSSFPLRPQHRDPKTCSVVCFIHRNNSFLCSSHPEPSLYRRRVAILAMSHPIFSSPISS